MGNITKTLKIFQQSFIVLTVVYILLIQPTASRPDDNNLSVCKAFTRNKEIKKRIETGQRHAPPCACAEQQMTLDSSFQKIDRCYVQWFFEYGVKQKCCYNEIGELQLGVPDGGYLLLEEINISYIKESCCSNTETCHVFYEINQSHNCSSYIPLQTVTSWGDPTIQTVDGAEYDFNGHGEYVFLKTSNVEIQARTDYITPKTKDATVFSAFALFDNQSGVQIEFHHNKTADDIIIYRNGTKYCNAKRDDGVGRLHPCPGRPTYNCNILAGGGIVILQGCGTKEFAKHIEISTSRPFLNFKIIIIDASKDIDSTGLAGNQQNGKLVGRDGSLINLNGSAYAKFNLSETWSLQNENESLFIYNITGGNYTSYNANHTTPTFFEPLIGNLTELFESFSPEDIMKFNNTCRNYWNNEPNEKCLLTIARTKDFSLGLAVMTEVNETHRIWEIKNNKSPEFLDGMPTNVSVTYKEDLNWVLDLKEYTSDETNGPLSYSVQTKLPTDEYSLENGLFNWTIGTGLRYTDTTFAFVASDRLNFNTTSEVSIRYCGCEQPSECNFEVDHANSTGNGLQKASCVCLKYYDGSFCENFNDPCQNGSLKCYNGHCNSTLPNSEESATSWPCLPCPDGLNEQFTGNTQNCNDIDECKHSGSVCHQNCNNTDGSYFCTCRVGFRLDSDDFHCIDIDECLDHDICKSGEICGNIPGNYICNCVPGYKRDEITNTCEEIHGKTYVSTISFSVVITKDRFDENEIDDFENRMKIQQTLQQRYKGTSGFISVEVIKLTIRIVTYGDNTRKKRANRRTYLDAEYVLHWEYQMNTSAIQKTLEKANSVDTNNTDQLLKPDGVISGLQILTTVASISVNTDICSVPGKNDCDNSSTTCVNLDGGFECQCKPGYEFPVYSRKYCKEINECDLFSKNNTVNDRCVDGSCLNVPGSWNCTCPRDLLWQSVGNDSVSVYKCQGNFTYIGNISLLVMSGKPGQKEIETFVANQLSVVFRNKSFLEDEIYDVHISSMFVSVSVLDSKEHNHSSISFPHVRYDTMFKLRMGNAIDTKRLQTVMNTLCDTKPLHMNNTINVFPDSCHIFDDTENILCNLTSNGDCDEVTTSCQQRSGTTYCECKSGYEKRYEREKFCRDVNECANATYSCLGGRCKNYPGNWSCTCNESFVPVRVDGYTLDCKEVHFNACVTYPKFECRNGNRSCINDKWKCNCRKGTLSVNVTNVLYICEDEDECINRKNTCSGHGKCKNHANGFTCDCDEGYGRNDTDPFNVTCIDIDECHSPDYSCVNGFCGNTVGNWTCSCNETGFVRKQVTPNAIVCEDIDECRNEHFFCGGECTNSFGSWTCDCKAGFTKYTSNDQITCEDINECDQKDACIDSACKNLDGSWTCLCQDGKEPKKINASTIACTGGYQYVMSFAFAVTETIGGHENELKMYLQYQITYVYEASFPNSKVRVEIISVSKDNTLRNKRNVENFKVKYVLHLDEQTELTEIKKAWHDYVTQNCTNGMCEQAHEMSAAISVVVLLSDEVAVDDNEGVCALPRYNLCDPHSTQCKYGNGTAKCECSKGFSRKSEIECIVSADACKDLPCGNGGTCRMVNVNKPVMHFECTCAEGWSGLTCTNQHKRLISPQETDIETTFIATGSTLGFLVIIMSVVVLVVCRWRRANVKEAAKLSKKFADSDDVKPLEGSTNHDRYFNKTYNIFSDSTSENSFRTFPQILSHGKIAGNFREFDTPHFKGSLPNIMHADAYIYRGDQRRYSFQEKRRYSSYDQDRNVDTDLNFEGNRMSLRHEIERPPSPLPDYNRTSNVDRGGIPTNDNRRSGHFDEFGAPIKF